MLGQEGDKINALLAGCGFNLRRLLTHLSKELYFLFIFELFVNALSFFRKPEAAPGCISSRRGMGAPDEKILKCRPKKRVPCKIGLFKG